MDYYSILGVPKNADESTIRKAYKKQSMQHHPDRGGNEEKFKEVNEAYQTLKDPQKRAEYDNPQPHFNFNSGDFRGGNPFEDLFRNAGFGGMNRRQPRNRDVTIGLNLDLSDVFKGKQLTTRYQLDSGKIKEADIDIPIGVPDGVGIKFSGLGDDTIPNFPPGDLIVRIRIKSPPNWKRTGNDLRTRVMTSVFDCLLGGSVELRTLEDKTLRVNIPRGTQPGAVFSIPGHGIPDIKRGTRGNLFVEINAVVPKVENKKVLQDIERIKDELNNN